MLRTTSPRTFIAAVARPGQAGGFLLTVLAALLAVPAAAQSLTFTHLAGSVGGVGSFDGAGSAARFNKPQGVAVDASGNLYVADGSNNTIRKVTAAGVVTTLAGLAGTSGSADGTGSAARFWNPKDVAVDAAGNVYVADQDTIRKVTQAGVVTTLAGLAGSVGGWDGTGSAARFYWPHGAAVDASGSVFVADSGNHTIRKVTPGGVVTTLAGLAGTSGSANGTGSAARFYSPRGVAVDASGNVYVADQGSNTIRKVTQAGVVTTLAGLAGTSGSSDGTGSAARFWLPEDVAVDASGNVFVADSANHTTRMVTPAGVVTTLAGLAVSWGSADGPGSTARFYWPFGVAVDASGNVYVADYYNDAIRKATSAGVVTTLAGLPGSVGSVDGTGSAARFYSPSGVAVDASGNAYVADYNNHTIRKVTPIGLVTTLAGLAGQMGSADATGNAARFRNPTGVAVDASGNAYVADCSNHTIRKVTPFGVVTTLAGLAGQMGSVDATGSAARFRNPSGVAVDASGNVYVADYSNHTIRKVTPGGMVTTLAGLAGTSGSADGTGSTARFWNPDEVALDASWNIYVADLSNHTIRKVTPGGAVITLAGLAGSFGSADGMGSAARFHRPSGVAVDALGSIYVADGGNYTIRKVTSAGVVTTTAGLAESWGSADGTGTVATFYGPSGLAVDASGNVYVADSNNHAIRKGKAALSDAATIDQASGPVGQARQLDSSPQTATTGLWEQVRIPSGSLATLSSTTVRNPTFTPDVAGYFVFRLTASNGTQTSITLVDLTAWAPPTATVSGGGTICAGGSAEIQAALTGTPPWSMMWSDGITQAGINTSPATRTVSPASTTVYTVTAVSDSHGSGTSSGSATVTVIPALATPVITAPDPVVTGATGLVASVAWHAGSTYAWSITNGSITGGQGTATITFTAGAVGSLTLGVVETASGCAPAQGTKNLTVVVSPTPRRLHTLTPCRLLDTRTGAGVAGGGALAPLEERSWTIALGSCGVPTTASAIAVNVTVVAPEAAGYLTLWPSDAAKPLASTINFTPGLVRANNAIVKVAPDFLASVSVFNGSTGTTDVLLDVNGYFD